MQNGETIDSVTLAVSGNGGRGFSGGGQLHDHSQRGHGGTFTPSNYNVTYNPGKLTVGKAPLTVTASAESKTYGQTVSFGSGSTLFTSSSLQNGETIGSVSLAVSGSGGAAAAAVGSYTITPSLATGGTFTASNYNITYATGLLTVNPATPVVHASNESVVYNGTSLSYPQLGTDIKITGISSGPDQTPSGTFSYSYTSSALGYGPTSTDPINAGTYTVTATFTTSDPNYTSPVSGTATFTIGPATPVVHTVNENTTYDGSPQSYPQLGSDVSVTGVSSGTDQTPSGNFSYSYSSSALGYGPTATAPTLPGTYKITVTFTSSDTNYFSATGTPTFTIILPSVTVSPTAGSQIGGTSVTITGTDFVGVSAVKFGSTAATSFTVDSATQITAISPAETAGTIDVTVTTPLGTSSTSSLDRFTYVPASTLSFTTPPPTTLINKTSVSVISVFVSDQFGNRVPNTSVKLTYPSGSATKTTTAVSDPTGTAFFYNVLISVSNVDAPYVVTAASTGVPNVTAPINVTGNAYALTFTSIPYSVTAGTDVPIITAQIIDAKGLPVITNPTPVALTISGTKFSDGSTKETTTTAAGLASFTGLSVNSSGTFTLTASSSGLISSYTSLTITPGLACSLTLISQPKSTTAGSTISTVTVQLYDVFGNREFGNPLASNIQVDMSITSTNPLVTGITLNSGTPAYTNGSGQAVFSAMTETIAGTYTLQASATLTPGPGLVYSSASKSFIISPAQPALLTFVNGPTDTTAGSVINSLSGGILLQLLDAYNNPVPKVVLAISTSPGILSTGTAILATNSSGLVTFGNLTENKAGIYTLNVRTLAVSSKLTASSSQFNILPATASKLTFSVQPTGTQATGTIGSATVQIVDKYGNAEVNDSTDIISNINVAPARNLLTFSGTTSLSPGNLGNAAFTDLQQTTAGTYTLTATATINGKNLSAASKAFIITAGSPVYMVFSSRPIPNGMFLNSQLGATTGTVIVQIFDQYGNYVKPASIYVTIAIDNSDGSPTSYPTKTIKTNSLGQALFSMTLSTAGSYELTATATGPNGPLTLLNSLNPIVSSNTFVISQAPRRWF